MNTKVLLKEALNLRPKEKLQFVEFLINSLDQPDEDVEKIWAGEVERRYKAYKMGKVRTIELKEIVKRYK